MQTRWFVVIESLGSWWVDCEGHSYGPVASKADAAVAARRLAKVFDDPGRRSEIWAPDAQGRPQMIWLGPAPRDAE
ncbi:MAG: hypothetical protein P4M09_30910 [Devosia sp.]|nr:hypothetical protein [Devosia sp.]